MKSQAQLQEIVGDKFKVIVQQGGGFQINLAKLADFGQDDDAKVQALQTAQKALKSQGIDATIKLSYPSGAFTGEGDKKKQVYASWPCLRIGGGDGSANLELAAENARLKAIIAAQAAGATPEVIAAMQATSQTTPTPTVVDNGAPPDDDIPF